MRRFRRGLGVGYPRGRDEPTPAGAFQITAARMLLGFEQLANLVLQRESLRPLPVRAVDVSHQLGDLGQADAPRRLRSQRGAAVPRLDQVAVALLLSEVPPIRTGGIGH